MSGVPLWPVSACLFSQADEEVTIPTWFEPRVRSGEPPSPRYGHTLTAAGGNFYLFGGVSETDDLEEPPAPNCELYAFTLKGDNATWACPATTGGPPSPRWQHTATAVDSTRLFVFGGNLSNQARLNDVWVLDTLSMEWSEQGAAAGTKSKQRTKGSVDAGKGDGEYKQNGGASSAPNAPAPRSAHSACLIDRSIFVFGGYGGCGTCSASTATPTPALFSYTVYTVSTQPSPHNCKSTLHTPFPRALNIRYTHTCVLRRRGGRAGCESPEGGETSTSKATAETETETAQNRTEQKV